MQLDELQAALTRATDAKEAAERGLVGASPEQRAALEADIRLASAQADEARNNLQAAEERQRQAEPPPAPEVCGFGGADLTPEEAQGFTPTEEKQRELKDPEAVKEPSTVRTYVTEHGHRIGGMAGRGERITEVHTHPDIVEARQATARQNALSERLAQERAQQQAEQKARAAAERKDMDRAAFEYEGLPQNRGITRADYIKMETGWKQHLDANPAKREDLATQEKASYLEKRSVTTGIPHREPEPGETIKGKVVGVRSFEGVKHTVIEKASPPPARIIVQGEVKGAQLGKEVEIKAGDDRRLQPTIAPKIPPQNRTR